VDLAAAKTSPIAPAPSADPCDAWSPSPLALLHPEGAVRASLVLGSACPPRLCAPSGEVRDGDCGLIVLSPSATECQASGWLDSAARAVQGRLADDGLVYVHVPWRWRAKTYRALRERGLQRRLTMLHAPNWRDTRFVIPLEADAVAYAASHLIPLTVRRGRLAAAAAGAPFLRTLVGLYWRPTALLFMRPGAPRVGRWMLDLLSDRAMRGGLVIGATTRQPQAVVHLVGSAAHLRCIAKLPLSRSVDSALEREALLIREHATAAETAGASVPNAQIRELPDGRRVFLHRPLEGAPAAILLASGRERMETVAMLVTGWLERWNRETVSIRPLEQRLLEREVLDPASIVSPFIDHGAELIAHLTARCAAVRGKQAPLVASHNDLTMWNVLIDPGRSLGILDWETARAESLPMLDFSYALADIAAAAARYTDRKRGYEACFGAHGRYTGIAAQIERRLRECLGVPPDVAALSFDACWIQHAANEVRRRGADAPRPFLGIVADRTRELVTGQAGGPVHAAA